MCLNSSMVHVDVEIGDGKSQSLVFLSQRRAALKCSTASTALVLEFSVH